MRTSFQALIFSIGVHLLTAFGIWCYLTYSEFSEHLEQEEQGWLPVGEVDYGYSFVYIGPFDNNLPLGLTILFSFTLLITSSLFVLVKFFYKKLHNKSTN